MVIGVGGKEIADSRVVFFGQGDIEQGSTRLSHEFGPGDKDVDPYREGDDRVEPLPPRQPDQSDSYQDAEGGPHIGKEMLAIGDKCHRSTLVTIPKQNPRHCPVDDRGQYRHEKADTGVRDGARIEEPLNSAVYDDRGGDEDHHSLGTC